MKNIFFLLALFTAFLGTSQSEGDVIFKGVILKDGFIIGSGSPGITPDVTAPVILSGPTVEVITSNGATISLFTDEPVSFVFEYGLTTSYGNSFTETSFSTNPTMTTAFQDPNTTYNFRFTITDSSGNSTVTSNGTYTTAADDSGLDITPPVIVSGPTASSIAQSNFRVNASFDEPVTIQVEYGLTGSYGNVTLLNSNLQTSHSELVPGLDPSTLYYWRIVIEDASGNQTVSTQQQTTTAASSTGFVDCTPSGGTVNVSDATAFQDAGNANTTMNITGNFTCNSCTVPTGVSIVPSGGVITATNLNLNGACIVNNGSQLFTSTSTFSALYENSRLSPEIFGAISGDAIDDHSAIVALVNNSRYATATLNGYYIKNSPSEFTRSGEFDWDVNGAEIAVTSNSNFRINQFDVDFVFAFTNTNVRVYNGEFNGNDIYGRLFWLKGQQYWYFADNTVYDWHSTSNARGLAFSMRLYPQSYGFHTGEFYRNNIDNIISDTDGIANNTNGLAKGVLMSLYEDGTANVYFEDNLITNIKGDDAECVYAAPQGSTTMTNNVNFYFTNETWKWAKRRQGKFTVSNLNFQSCYFEAPGVAQDFNGQAVALLSVFSTRAGEVKNLVIQDSDFVQNGTHVMGGLYLTEIENPVIENNRFTWSDVSNYAGISIGTSVAGYDGVMRDVTIRNNTFTNCYLQIAGPYFDVQGTPLTFDSNTFNINWGGNNPGNYVGILRYSAYGSPTVSEPVTISNSTINYNTGSSFGLFRGLVMSFTATVQNFTADTVTLNYTGTLPGQTFGHIGTTSTASFGSSNVIRDVTVNGVANGTLQITGPTNNPQIINSNVTVQ